MKTLISLLIISFYTLAAPDLSSPRETFRTFLKSMVQVKNNDNVKQAYARAASALDLSHIDPAAKAEASIKISESLINIFDRMERIQYEKIPTNPKSNVWV